MNSKRWNWLCIKLSSGRQFNRLLLMFGPGIQKLIVSWIMMDGSGSAKGQMKYK